MDESLGAWLVKAIREYQPISETANIEVSALAAHVLGVNRAWVAAHTDKTIPTGVQQQLNDLLARLVSGEPLPYLTGVQEFYGLEIIVNENVLIPRPETELLVAQALAWLAGNPEARSGLDVCTGSGCAAIAMCANKTGIHMIATDISMNALNVAKHNVTRHRLEERIDLALADLTTPLIGKFPLIVANPPYIPSARLASLQVTRHEPALALDGGEDGMDLIARILSAAPGLLASPGLLLCEIDETQEHSALNLAAEYFPQADRAILNDLAQKPRLLRVEQKDNQHD